jgi:hypothetical protein
VLVYLLTVKGAQAAGQNQADSSPEKREGLPIPGVLVNEIVSVNLLASPAAV